MKCYTDSYTYRNEYKDDTKNTGMNIAAFAPPESATHLSGVHDLADKEGYVLGKVVEDEEEGTVRKELARALGRTQTCTNTLFWSFLSIF